METDGIEVFVAVVDAQSFSRAARRLGLPTSTVSARIERLETRLGVTLILRSTRRMSVTPQGRRYYQYCTRALAELAEAEREIVAARDEPSGLLRITVPGDLAQSLVAPLAARYLALYPRASLELVVTNRVVDLVAEEIDLAVRVGPLQSSALKSRRFREGLVAFWAAPAYLARKGAPASPADLVHHDLVRFSSRRPREVLQWEGGEVEIDLRGARLAADDIGAISALIVTGNGIGVLPEFAAEDLAAEGKLTRVLPTLRGRVGDVHFVYPAQTFIPPAVRAFIDLAAGGASAGGLEPDGDNG